MLILIGSTRPAKVEGTRQALEEIGRIDPRFTRPELRPCDVSGAAPVMPTSEAAILDGARARAAALLDQVSLADHREAFPQDWYAIGLEGGLDLLAGADSVPVAVLKTWACVTDGRRWSYGAGGAIAIPSPLARMVAGGRELGDLIDELAGEGARGTRGAWGVLTRDLVTRGDIFRVAVISAFAPFYNSELYESVGSRQ